MASKLVRPLVKFPYKVKKDGKTMAVIDKFDMSRFEETKAMYQAAAAMGDGYNEAESTEEFLRKEFTENPAITVTSSATGKMIAVMPIHAGPVCRSTKPLVAAASSVVDPTFRGVGLAMEMYRVGVQYSIDNGYIAGSARIVITGRNVVPVRSQGFSVVGIIPHCTELKKLGFMDDVVTFRDYELEKNAPDIFNEIVEPHTRPLPYMDESKAVESFLWNGRTVDPKEMKTKTGTIRIRSPRGLDEVLHVEKFWREAAERGQGFGLDEFTEDGYFNRKFYRESNILIAENNQGDIVGTSLFGPTFLSRSPKPVIACMYTGVPERYSNHGVGKSLLTCSLDIIKGDGYKGCISDTFTNNYKMLLLLRQLQFSYRGCFPMAAYLKDIGLSESLIVYRELK